MSTPAPVPLPNIKLLLCGSSSVGKSSLLLRFTDELFLGPAESQATIGVDFKTKVHTVRGTQYKLSIWDTAGQERFRTLTSSYYRGAQGVILAYDVTDRASFSSLSRWLTELETYASPDAVIMIVGNKIDKGYQVVVKTEEGKAFADRCGALFIEASAKTDRGVKQAFDDLVTKVVDTPSLWQAPETSQGKVQIDEAEVPDDSACAC